MFQRWFEQISEFIDQRLSPYDDQITELMERFDDLERRVRGVAQPGRVIDIHDDGQRIKVAFGKNHTPWINWFAAAAGEVKEYRCPSIGEQCVLINYAGGDNSTQAWALCGMSSDQFAKPSSNPDEHVVEYPDGTRITYNHQSHLLSIDVKGNFAINSSGWGQVVTDGALLVKSKKRLRLKGPSRTIDL